MKSSVVRFAALACVLVLALMGGAVWAEDEVLPVAASAPGFKAESSYQNLGNGENVSPFSGGLTVTHASSIGLLGNMGGGIRPTRVFNSLSNYAAYVYATLTPEQQWDRPIGPLGAGWHLGVGRVFTRIILDQYEHFYEDESGAEHRLYKYYGDYPVPEGQQVTWYLTNDGSYIRARFTKAALNVTFCDKGQWTLYFPDGSTRQAGDTTKNAFVATEYYGNPATDVTNPWSNGWYVTEITDRAGNTTKIVYRQFDPSLAPFATSSLAGGGGGGRDCTPPAIVDGLGFAGCIDTITDHFGRKIKFTYGTTGTMPGAAYLLQKIELLNDVSAPIRTEEYSYSTSLGSVGFGYEPWPVLSAVQDAGGLVTRYDYFSGGTTFPANPNLFTATPLLKTIYYPTGGLSSYSYQPKKTFFYSPASRQRTSSLGELLTFVVSTHSLEFRAESGAQSQKLTWRWRYLATQYPLLFTQGYGYRPVQLVVTQDPLGKEEVRYFATEEWLDPNDPHPLVPPGTELLRTVRKPGAPELSFAAINAIYSGGGGHYNVWEQVISWERKEYGFGGGDADLCYLRFGRDTMRVDPLGNARAWRVVQAEIGTVQTNPTCEPLSCGDGTSGASWVKEVKAFDWNDFGQYTRIETRDLTPGGDPTVKLAKSIYTSPPILPWRSALDGYQADLLIYSASGSAGLFRAVSYVRDTNTGLVQSQRWYVKPQSNIDTPTADASDKLLTITYTNNAGNKGNILTLLYSGGDSLATYQFNFTWNHGQVSEMSRRVGNAMVVQFSRAIDPSTSLITSNTDQNSLTASFQYDTLGRLTRIIPPGEHSTYVSYPTDSTTAGGQTWTTSHDILFYRGPEKTLPGDMASFSEVGWLTYIDSGAVYQHYIFDDLGRSVKSRSLHPDGYLAESMTAYDPMGKAFFTSLPYRFDTPPPMGTLDWGGVDDDKLPNSGDLFISTIVMNPQATASPYGQATSIYSGATWPSSVNPGLAKLIAGTREPFDRGVWAFGLDGSRAKTTYEGLDSATTLFGIKTGATIDLNDESKTWYRKDIWGRLKRVEPPGTGTQTPIGTPADYTYNGLDQLTTVNLTGQVRTFTYDALGRILTAQNPENGTTTYTGYDCIGNVLGAQDANGIAGGYRIKNEYDDLGRLTATRKVDASTGALIQTLVENTYDALPGYNLGPSMGKLVQTLSLQDLLDNPGVESKERFAFQSGTGRVITVTQATTAGGGEENRVILAYDAYGQMTDQTLPDDKVLTNIYSHGAVVQRQVNGTPVIEALQYDVTGMLKKVLFSTGESQETDLDEFKRPKGFAYLDDQGIPLWGNGSYKSAAAPYTYDGAGNIASIGVSATQADTFTYDALSRLTAASVYRKEGLHQFAYSYDIYGNLTGRNETVPTAFQNTDLKHYLTETLLLDESEATEYIKATVFNATMGPVGQVTNNRVASVARATDTGLTPSLPQTMGYDANGNLTSDGTYTYGYDALNRQVSVTEISTGNIIAEYVYLASGERIAVLKYIDQVLSDYTRYFRDGSAVIWEKTDATSRAKFYLYAGGRMAYTQENWTECTYPMGMSASTLTLGTPTVIAPLGSATASAEFTLPNLPAAAVSVEVRLVKGNSLVSSQRLERPAGGWCGQERVTFAGLPEGGDYQAGLTVFTREGRAKRMPAKAYLVERMKLGLVRGKLAAWTATRFKEEAGGVREEGTTGFASLAPEGAEDYTATAKKGPEAQQVAQGRSAEDVVLPDGSTTVAILGTTGSGVSLASPTLGLTRGGGGIQPICTRHSVRTYYGVDHLGTVRYTKTVDDEGYVTTTTHDYEPFGVELPGKDTCGNTHQFTGHERDWETGNDYMHFRMFASNMARFMKPDSRFDNAARNPQGFNLYSYVSGNPVNRNDPTGHAASEEAPSGTPGEGSDYFNWLKEVPGGVTPVGAGGETVIHLTIIGRYTSIDAAGHPTTHIEKLEVSIDAAGYYWMMYSTQGTGTVWTQETFTGRSQELRKAVENLVPRANSNGEIQLGTWGSDELCANLRRAAAQGDGRSHTSETRKGRMPELQQAEGGMDTALNWNESYLNRWHDHWFTSALVHVAVVSPVVSAAEIQVSFVKLCELGMHYLDIAIGVKESSEYLEQSNE